MKKKKNILFKQEGSDLLLLKFDNERNVGFIFNSYDYDDGTYDDDWSSTFNIPQPINILSEKEISLAIKSINIEIELNGEDREFTNLKNGLIELKSSSELSNAMIKEKGSFIIIGDFMFKSSSLLSLRKVNKYQAQLNISRVKEDIFLNEDEFNDLKKIFLRKDSL